MFELTHEEHTRIINAVQAVLACSDKDKVLVNFNDLCEKVGCGKSNAARTMLVEEIRDLLSAHNTVQLFGLWVFVFEFDDNVCMFVQVSKPGQKVNVSNLLVDGNAAAFSFNTNWPKMLKVGKKTVELPNVFVAESASTDDE